MRCWWGRAGWNSAALGLEEYYPFLDWRGFEFILALPGERKIRNGVTESFAREAYKGLLPAATRTRIKKTGWNAPAHQWFAGAGREPLLDLLSSRRFVERGIYNGPALLKLIDAHQDIMDQPRGRQEDMQLRWQIVTREWWVRSVQDNPQ